MNRRTSLNRNLLVAAVVLHVALLFSAIPTLQSSQAEPAEKPKAFVVKTTRFEKPPPPGPPHRPHVFGSHVA